MYNGLKATMYAWREADVPLSFFQSKILRHQFFDLMVKKYSFDVLMNDG